MSPQQHRRELCLSKNPFTRPLPLEPGQNGFIGEIQCSRPKRLQPFRSKRRGGYALDEKVCSFRRTRLRSDFVKRQTFNSGSFHCRSNGEGPKSKEISWQRPFNTYFLFIVRSRNSCINDPIRSTSSSNAKWPVSRRWSSALGISVLKSSAPSTVKIPSFLPQVISVGGCCLRKYFCQSA